MDAEGSPITGRPLQVVVATITRRRPRMLAALLRSWSELERPRDCSCTFLVVENDERPTVGMPDTLAGAWEDAELLYFREPHQGIPIARNRACRIALERNADVLLFIDDDETADRRWLVNMVEAYRRTGSGLIGGPVEPVPPPEPLTFWQRVVFRGVRDRLARKYARTQLYGLDATTVVTSNWLADISLIAKYGLSFDERLRLTGGSDAKFCHDARLAGVRVGWASDAVVRETISADRLSLRYQFRRARDQSNVSLRRKIERNSDSLWWVPVSVALRTAGAGLQILLIPITRGSSLVPVARSLGWIVGRVSVFWGATSSHYRETTGA